MPYTEIILGDAATRLADVAPSSVDTCITSPPYYCTRDYGHSSQIGRETSPEAYVSRLVDVFRGVRRALKPQGTVFLNVGDSYVSYKTCGAGGGLKTKDLIGIPWMLAFALRADGWFLRSEIIWHKPCPTPESVTDRPTRAHETVFLLSKSPIYFYNLDAIAEPCTRGSAGSGFIGGKASKADAGKGDRVERDTRNVRSVWTYPTQPYRGPHPAMMPIALAERCVLAGCPAGGLVLDPFLGAGTTALAANRAGRDAMGIELNADYTNEAVARIRRAGHEAEVFGEWEEGVGWAEAS